MKKQVLLMLLLGLMTLATAVHAQDGENMLGRQTQNEGFCAVPAKRPVTIDGTLDE
jgi:hypothetical protein